MWGFIVRDGVSVYGFIVRDGVSVYEFIVRDGVSVYGGVSAYFVNANSMALTLKADPNSDYTLCCMTTKCNHLT